jgi:hypothetical protein
MVQRREGHKYQKEGQSRSVYLVKYGLCRAGLIPSNNVDGWAGPRLREAYADWQRRRYRGGSGIPDCKTLRDLNTTYDLTNRVHGCPGTDVCGNKPPQFAINVRTLKRYINQEEGRSRSVYLLEYGLCREDLIPSKHIDGCPGPELRGAYIKWERRLGYWEKRDYWYA